MLVVVLGAGIIGTTTAFRLAEAGHAVTVVDRQPDAGLETSFANGGLVTPATSDSWAAPETPTRILKWLGRGDAPMLLRLAAVPGMVSWGIRFLANCRPEQWRFKHSGKPVARTLQPGRASQPHRGRAARV